MDDLKAHKLPEGIPTNSMKIIDLYNKIDSGQLNPQPKYQRKLVWKKQHKYAFIDTILLNFPFPEVYIASAEIDVEKMRTSEVVVDGQQRLTTIVEYIKGEGDFTKQSKVPTFNSLSPVEKKEFLNYKVSVKDLKDIGEETIKEIFKRINSTEYALNTAEKNNAIYGAGEISIFCKQLVEGYTATEDDTDIIIPPDIKQQFNTFFETSGIFSDNDRKRMYNFQYMMLLTSTILEGNYFIRSSKIDEYLEKYHGDFPHYQTVINLLLKAINAVLQLKLSKKSYWYNQANMFTLLIELSKVDVSSLNFEKLEQELLELEEKVDIYYNADDESEMEGITEDEKRYFEAARHGSHEKPARDHRGKVIREIIESCMNTRTTNIPSSIEEKNILNLHAKGIEYAILTPTETGLKKSILDAISGVRDLLDKFNIHHYDDQNFGPTYKVKLGGILKDGNVKKSTEVSLYRSNGRGDYRIWFTDLKTFAEAGNQLAIIIEDGTINLLNISRFDYSLTL